MEYTINAKETIYNGVVFRSRLEAKWAAFFDLINWEWQYEPFDFNGWTPDFMITGKNGCKLFIEVKPILDKSIVNDYVIKSKGAGDFLCVIIGSNVCFVDGTIYDPCSFGYVINQPIDENGLVDIIDTFDWKYDGSTAGLASAYGLWDDIFGQIDRKHFVRNSDKEDLINLFKQAGNITQRRYGEK